MKNDQIPLCQILLLSPLDMISKEEKEKQRKDLNKFIERNVKGINKIGVAASGRHVHKKGGRQPSAAPPPFCEGLFCLFLGHFVQ